jgi:hypothetical protein
MQNFHGEIEISLDDNVITALFSGSFNYECVHDYAKRIKLIVASLEQKAFFMMIDNTNFEGCTPEGFEELDIFNAWLNQTQLKAKAFIITSEVNRHIIETRTPALSSQNTCFFSDHQTAYQWIESFF